METSQASQLSNVIREKAADFEALCNDLDEETASLAPSGRWSPKEIVSHLCGPDGIGHMPIIHAFLEKDTPTVEIEVENAFFSEHRAGMTFAELLSEFNREYGHMAEFIAGLSDEQLSRKAHMPILKNSQLGEYPTLAGWIQILADHHLGSHTDHMREILEALAAESQIPKKQASQEIHADSPSGL
jgi:hypothetical protein